MKLKFACGCLMIGWLYYAALVFVNSCCAPAPPPVPPPLPAKSCPPAGRYRSYIMIRLPDGRKECRTSSDPSLATWETMPGDAS